MTKKKFYITTALPYVNASPHIGMALEYVQADTIARYRRQEGDDVFFLTGADENSLKNVQAAEKEGISTKELVNKNTKRFIEANKVLNISNDDFIRTIEDKHFKAAQKLWLSCRPEDVYKKKYKGLYCVGCEQFYTKKELVDGKCPEHKEKLEEIEEENYFFKLSNYQEKLENLIESDEYEIIPPGRKNEVLSFIKAGLEDFSISRSKERAKNWGVPIPGDESQVMYVWFDALGNYISALDYDKNGDKFKRYWPADVHIIGKGIIRFHAVYWPAMLLSAGIQLPKKLFVHGYITLGGQKMSKSLGNIVDPFGLVLQYGVDAVRYFLLREITSTEDGDFTYEKFEERYNSDLAAGIGNLVARVITLAAKLNQKSEIRNPKQVKIQNQELKKEIQKINNIYKNKLDEFKFNEALIAIWDLMHSCDVLIEKEKPWEGGKEDVISDLLFTIENIARMIEPFLPETSENIKKQLEFQESKTLFPRLKKD